MAIITGTLLGRVRCTTTTQGTGSYVVLGAVNTSFFDFTSVGTTKVVPYVCCDGVNSEEGDGTITVSGGTTSLTRNVTKSTNSNNPVSWGPGTRDIFITFQESTVVLTNRASVFESGATLKINGNDFVMSPDEAVKIGATNSLLTFTAGSNTFSLATSTGQATLSHSDNGATAGPGLRLHRESSSPADNDIGEPLTFSFKDDAGNITDVVKFVPTLLDASNGSEDGQLTLQILVNNSFVDFLKMSGTSLIYPSTVNLLGGKLSPSLTSQGIELRGDGTAAIIAGAAQPLNVGRSNDGPLVDWRIAGSAVGTVSASSGVITYGTFSGAHYSDWADGHEPDEDPPLGSLVCAVDQSYANVDGVFSRLPRVRRAMGRRDKAVYGQYGGWETAQAELPDDQIAALQQDPTRWRRVVAIEPIVLDKADATRLAAEGMLPPPRSIVCYRRMQVWAIGTAPLGIPVLGPVEVGDTVITSDTPGVAELAPEGTDVRYVVGKVFEPVPPGVVKNVRGVVYAG